MLNGQAGCTPRASMPSDVWVELPSDQCFPWEKARGCEDPYEVTSSSNNTHASGRRKVTRLEELQKDTFVSEYFRELEIWNRIKESSLCKSDRKPADQSSQRRKRIRLQYDVSNNWVPSRSAALPSGVHFILSGGQMLSPPCRNSRSDPKSLDGRRNETIPRLRDFVLLTPKPEESEEGSRTLVDRAGSFSAYSPWSLERLLTSEDKSSSVLSASSQARPASVSTGLQSPDGSRNARHALIAACRPLHLRYGEAPSNCGTSFVKKYPHFFVAADRDRVSGVRNRFSLEAQSPKRHFAALLINPYVVPSVPSLMAQLKDSVSARRHGMPSPVSPVSDTVVPSLPSAVGGTSGAAASASGVNTPAHAAPSVASINPVGRNRLKFCAWHSSGASHVRPIASSLTSSVWCWNKSEPLATPGLCSCHDDHLFRFWEEELRIHVGYCHGSAAVLPGTADNSFRRPAGLDAVDWAAVRQGCFASFLTDVLPLIDEKFKGKNSGSPGSLAQMNAPVPSETPADRSCRTAMSLLPSGGVENAAISVGTTGSHAGSLMTPPARRLQRRHYGMASGPSFPTPLSLDQLRFCSTCGGLPYIPFSFIEITLNRETATLHDLARRLPLPLPTDIFCDGLRVTACLATRCRLHEWLAMKALGYAEMAHGARVYQVCPAFIYPFHKPPPGPLSHILPGNPAQMLPDSDETTHAAIPVPCPRHHIAYSSPPPMWIAAAPPRFVQVQHRRPYCLTRRAPVDDADVLKDANCTTYPQEGLKIACWNWLKSQHIAGPSPQTPAASDRPLGAPSQKP